MFNGIISASESPRTTPDEDPSQRIPEGAASAHGRMRETARSIEDRIRRVLVPPGSPIASLRFLVVDDHPDSADALAAVMELIGCQVRVCYDAASAMLLAAEFKPQVCLLDLKMPGMSGFELAGHLRAQVGSGARLLIATTALGDEASRKQSQAAGFHLHLVKPVDVPSLIDAITRLWEIAQEQSGGQSEGTSRP